MTATAATARIACTGPTVTTAGAATDALGERRRPRRRAAKLAALGVAATALVAPGLGGEPAGAANPLWGKVTWTAPITAAGPNAVAAPLALAGTATPLLGGNPNRVDYAIAAPAGHPAACAVPSGTATLQGRSFTFTPDFRCNGTYGVTVVARTGSGLLASSSNPLTAPIALADPGPAPSGLSGAVDSATRQVAISWTPDPAPDVVGYRVRRDGIPVTDVAPTTRTYTGTVPAAGRYEFDVQTLRWGADGPGSASLASPASGPFTATIDPPAPEPSPGDRGTGLGSGTGSGSSSGSGGSGGGTITTGGSLPAGGTASPTLPAPRGAAGSGSSRSTYRSGGSISRSTPTNEVDTFEERLPYEARDTGRTVELAGPDTTRTVARTVTKPGRAGPGLVVPAAVVLVLLAASLQIRSFLHRTAPAGMTVSGGSPPSEG